MHFDNPAYKHVWLSANADMTIVVQEIIASASSVSQVYAENCLTIDTQAVSSFINFFNPVARKRGTPANKIAFFAASDTLAFLLSPVIHQLQNNNPAGIELRTWHRERPNERAREGFASNGMESQPFSFWELLKFQPQVLVVGNDWTADSQLMIALGRWMGMRTVCLQESVIDLADTKRARMRWADFALLQGAVAVKQVPERRQVFVTGNPRYEQLAFQQTGNEKPFFLINCNFTYGVHEDQREAWLAPVVAILEELKADYVIAQHPRDTGDLSAYRNVTRTNAAIIHELIRKSDCIISRFSSVLHEGLFLGKKAVYFNPHGESVGYDYGFDNQALFYATDAPGLREALNQILQSTHSAEAAFRQYLEKNCHYGLGKPSETIAALLPQLTLMKGDGKWLSLLKSLWSTLKLYYFPKK